MESASLRYIQSILFAAGILPPQMVKWTKKLYTIYGNIIQALFVLFLTSIYVQVPVIWHDRKKLIDSVNLIISCTVLTIRVYISRTNSFQNLVYEMVLTEERMKTTKDKEALNVYETFLRRSKIIQLSYLIGSSAGAFMLVFPFFVKYIILWDGSRSDGTLERPLPYSSWLPFNKDEHYVISFVINVCFASVSLLYYSVAPEVLLILTLYVSFRLQLLNYFLQNVKKYSKIVSHADETEDNEAVETVFRLCVLEHLDIIRYTNTLNETIKYSMMLEFVLNSAQIALLLFEVMSCTSPDEGVFASLHFIVVFTQVLVLYWYANEIRINSEATSYTLYETDWIEFDKRIKSAIHIMMVRAQKPLALTVGPFGELSLEMLIKILKGAYTYITVLQSTTNNGPKA